MARLFCRAMAVIPRKGTKSIGKTDGLVIMFPINQKTDTSQPVFAETTANDRTGTVAVIP